jgi:hypothetical protein
MASSIIKNDFGIKVDTATSGQITLGANAGSSGSITIPTFTGYILVGIIGYDISSWDVFASRLRYETDNSVVYSIHNTASASRTVTINVRLLYRKVS